MSEKLEKLGVGAVVDGKVVNVKPFGALVLLPDGTQGLVHISHISASYVQDVSDYIGVGDIVRVRITSIDPATKKIALSMKDAVGGEQSKFVPQKAESKGKGNSFEDKLKEWVKVSNERQAGINKRNKRR